jgi:hypothetical protein
MILALMLGLSAFALHAQPAVAFIRNAKQFDGAGCSLRLVGDRANTEDRYVFLSDFDGRAVMNIERRDKELKLVKSSGANRPPRKGDRSIQHFRGEGVEVIIKYVVTRVCAPNDEKCEVIGYDAAILVRTNLGERTIRARGVCGS